MPPTFRLTAAVLDAPDPQGLARSYQALLGRPLRDDHPERATLRPADGGTGLSFQREEQHVPPVWPAGPGDPRMRVHLDIEVDDLAAAARRAVDAGATVAGVQPQDGVRICPDPAGHPFCLFLPGA